MTRLNGVNVNRTKNGLAEFYTRWIVPIDFEGDNAAYECGGVGKCPAPRAGALHRPTSHETSTRKHPAGRLRHRRGRVLTFSYEVGFPHGARTMRSVRREKQKVPHRPIPQ